MEEPSAQDAAKLDDNPLKRKSAPELSPESPKRTRMDSDGAAAEHREPPKRPVEEARARVAQEEKRRGMRLFGGLLGTLSQRQANPAQQRKRLEIERRQQERLKAQRDVEERALEEKRAAREEMRGRESIKWEEQVVCLLPCLKWMGTGGLLTGIATCATLNITGSSRVFTDQGAPRDCSSYPASFTHS